MSTKKCNVCECDFNIESEGGVEGNFGVLEVAFCPTCYVCMCDMVTQGAQRMIALGWRKRKPKRNNEPNKEKQ